MTLKILVCDKTLDEGVRVIEVKDHEPAENSGELLELKNVIAKPHTGACAQEVQLRSSILIATKVIKAFEKAYG